MISGIYFFNGKDITMNMVIQIRAILDELQDRLDITFTEAVRRFYNSKTYVILQNTENGLWAESAQFIVDEYFEELEEQKRNELYES